MSQEPSASHDQKLFTTMAVDVLSIVMHACAVERINKGHGYVHSKARASLGNETTQDCLYIFTNESLLYKKTTPPAVLGSFESFVLSLNLETDQSDDILLTLNNIPVADYLPSTRPDPASARPVRRVRAERDADGSDEDMEDGGEGDEDEEEEDEDGGESSSD